MNTLHLAMQAAFARLRDEMRPPERQNPPDTLPQPDRDREAELQLQRLAQSVVQSERRARDDFARLCNLLADTTKQVEKYLPPDTIAAMAMHTASLANLNAQIRLRKLVGTSWEISSDEGVMWEFMHTRAPQCQPRPVRVQNKSQPERKGKAAKEGRRKDSFTLFLEGLPDTSAGKA